MADEEHLAILRKGIEAWNAWRLRNPAVEPDFSSAILSDFDLGRPNFRRTHLSRAKLFLRGADLNHADLRGADLSDADLRDADLRDADLSGANLDGAHLSRADLRGAELGNARLRGAYLRAAKLHRAYLGRADLRGAELTDADLSDADLSRASLRGTVLGDCVLTRADLSGAILGESKLAHLDLSRTKGLSRARHVSPSSISTDTFALSQGGIPAAFLRGCGLADWEITATRLYDPDLAGVERADLLREIVEQQTDDSAFGASSCFISYSHANGDQDFARRLHDGLQDRGVRCWLDEHQLLPGGDIYGAVDRGIRRRDKVLLCCSEDSLTSWWVGDEIDKALEKEHRFLKERHEGDLAILPLDLDGFLLERWQDDRAATIRERWAADFRHWAVDDAKFEAQLERLVKALRAGGREPATVPQR